MNSCKIFIFDGVNGSGKTELINLLNTKLSKELKGYKIITVPSPGSGIKGIRPIFKDPENRFDPLTYLLLISSDVNEMIHSKILPEYNNDKCIFLLDRLFDSTYIYQGILNNVSIDKIDIMLSWCMKDISINKTFILDIPYDISESRRKNEGFKDAFEKDFKDTFDIIRNGYIERSKLDNHILIDADRHKLDVYYDLLTNIVKEI